MEFLSLWILISQCVERVPLFVRFHELLEKAFSGDTRKYKKMRKTDWIIIFPVLYKDI